jgi:hypothetical protein
LNRPALDFLLPAPFRAAQTKSLSTVPTEVQFRHFKHLQNTASNSLSNRCNWLCPDSVLRYSFAQTFPMLISQRSQEMCGKFALDQQPSVAQASPVRPWQSAALARRISNRYSQIIRNRPNSFSANTKCISNRYNWSNSHSRAALHSSLVANACHRLTSFLFDTNKPRKIIILVSLPLKTKEKQFSIRYKWRLRGTGLPAAAGHLACASWFWAGTLIAAEKILNAAATR